MIKMVFCDIDGCMGDFNKPEYPLKQDLEKNQKNLELIKNKRNKFDKVFFGVATARSFYQADHIMELTNHQGPSIFEMGNVIFDPKEGVYNLFERHEKFKDNIEDIKQFIDWKNKMIENEQEIKNHFLSSNVRQMKDRTCMLTYEFDQNIGGELYDFLESFMPDIVKQLIEKNILKIIFSNNALDIIPDITKGDAVDFLIKKYNIDKNEVLAIGDSSHSDLDLLNSAGFIACPANADESLKRFVLSKNGFVAPNSSSHGLLEILDNMEHFITNNLKKDLKFNNKKILVLGDYCIDEFLEGESNNVSPEAPILRALIKNIKTNPGMTGNIVLGVKALEAETYAIGIIGEDKSSKQLIETLKKNGINTDGMFFQKNRIIPRFSRIILGGEKYPKQSAIRFDIENSESASEESLQKIISFIENKKERIDAIIIADYDEVGKGIITKELLEKITILAKQNNIILVGDSREKFNLFNNFNCIVPNISEAEQIYERKQDSQMPEEIINKLNLDSILITKDREGIEITTKQEKKSIPALAEKVIDVTGAGDSVTCAFTLGLCSNLGYIKSAELASYAAAIAVSKPMLAVVTLDELENFMKDNHLE